MTRGDLLKKLFASHANPVEFRAAANLLIADEERKNNRVLANGLRKALDAADDHTGFADRRPDLSPTSLSALPQEKDKGLPLTEFARPIRTRSDIVLSRQNRALLERVVEEYRKGELLRRHGIRVSSKMLFCGPPGCGKTLCAEVFAKEVGLPLVVARFDVLVSSFLGETSTNLRRIFEFSQSTPSVLLLDEFDSVARSRDDETEHSELKRVVNSLLQLIDRFTGRGFLIASTNHESKLDSAIWRRFDEVVLFDKPEHHEIRATLRMKLRNFGSDFDPLTRADLLAGFSYAEIERVCQNAIKRSLLKGDKRIGAETFDEAITMERLRRQVVNRIGRNLDEID